MKKRVVLALVTLLIASGGIGMSSLTHEEMPVSEELLAEALEEEVPEEIITEEAEEVKTCLEGCTLEEGHEGACVLKKEDVEVILKTTSMEKDLKVKFVDKKSGKVITGADFKMKLTGPSKKTKEYSDHDQDGIIWVKDIEGGSYTVEMLSLDGYVTAKNLTAEVKKKIEYKVVEIADEVKSESEVEVSKEDGAYGGTNKDDSTSGSVVLKDTVAFVESTKKEVTRTTEVQKKDSFGQPVYEKQKKDVLGQPVYAKILSESAEFHTFNDQNVCTRCGAKKACAVHVDNNDDDKCDVCGASVPDLHTHTLENCVCKDCKKEVHGEVADGICQTCKKLVKAEEHKNHVDSNTDGACDFCGKAMPAQNEGAGSGEDPNPNEGANASTENPSQEGETPETEGQPQSSSDAPAGDLPQSSILFRKWMLLGTEKASDRFIKYDTSSAPVYDASSKPVYETETTYVYTGWQTIDGATYFFDKDGNKVTGEQVIEGIAYTFSSDGVRSGTIGIDVSKYQTGINWTKVKNAGINFVMIRCGYRGYGSGVLVEDPLYRSHISGAKAAGLRVGVYFFSQAVNEAEAVEEASMAVSLAKKYGINMPIAIDSEYAAGGRGRADGLSKSARTAVTKAFCDTVKSAGYTPMVYASKSWFSDHLNVSQLSGYRIWVAHYSNKCGYTGKYHIWQNTDKGKVDGVPGYVDMNISSI